jgi:hypothetical protein
MWVSQRCLDTNGSSKLNLSFENEKRNKQIPCGFAATPKPYSLISNLVMDKPCFLCVNNAIYHGRRETGRNGFY